MVNAEKRRRTATPTRAAGSGSASLDGSAGPPASTRPSIAARVRYRFDLALSRGPMVVIGYLGLVMLAIIVAASMLIWVFQLKGVNGGQPIGSPFDAFWQAMLRVVDSGTFAGDATWPTRVVSLLITIAGIFLAGSLIGLIANAVDQQVDQLRKGRSTVIEEDHTLVLGWSPRLPTILRELAEANASRKKAAVVILANVPKDEMEDELRLRVPDLGTTHVVCRTGDPSRAGDLEMVAASKARSVIVLAGDDGDAGVVKAVLSVRSLDPGFERAHVVAELENAGHGRTLRTLTEGRIVTIQADEVIARVTAQACHQAGLSAVFRDLLDFDGDEIYFTRVPELDGHPYREVLHAFATATPIGWITRDRAVELNPDPDAQFPEGAELVSVAEDDDTVAFTGFVPVPEVAADTSEPFREEPVRVLVIGWSDLGPGVLSELDEFLAPGSTIDLVVDPELLPPGDDGTIEPAVPHTANATVDTRSVGGGPEELLAIAAHGYDQAIVLGYRGDVPVGESDARTMLTLLTLAKAWPPGSGGPRVVAEMLDRANVAVAQTTGVEDFIVSDELSSLMMAQLSERLELHLVFDELFDADGCFVSLHPARLYAPAREVTFSELVSAASARGETALGWRLDASAEVVLNPAKADVVTLGPADQVLVLARR